MQWTLRLFGPHVGGRPPSDAEGNFSMWLGAKENFPPFLNTRCKDAHESAPETIQCNAGTQWAQSGQSLLNDKGTS